MITLIGTAPKTKFRAIAFSGSHRAGLAAYALPKLTTLSKTTLGNGNFRLVSKLALA